MRNKKSIVANISNVKQGSVLHVARISDYNDRTAMATQPRPVRHTVPKKRGTNQQTELLPTEEERLNDLVVRFQAIVVERNARLGERARATVENPDIVRAGLLALERLRSDDDFYNLVINAQNRQ